MEYEIQNGEYTDEELFISVDYNESGKSQILGTYRYKLTVLGIELPTTEEELENIKFNSAEVLKIKMQQYPNDFEYDPTIFPQETLRILEQS
ncbi:hypothetical protein [Alkalihalobacterium elongatum]|uniref:hypothetical protein n=1 Tax=Alkalihalobacterium elongatum TaxID=2675466 RepID=UPI001C1F6FB7|nr:hypothetical protein [Alkalihalobacterium elongatum]